MHIQRCSTSECCRSFSVHGNALNGTLADRLFFLESRRHFFQRLLIRWEPEGSRARKLFEHADYSAPASLSHSGLSWDPSFLFAQMLDVFFCVRDGCVNSNVPIGRN